MTSGFHGHFFTPHSWLRQNKQEVLISTDAVKWQITAQDCARPMPFNHATILASVGFSTDAGPAALIMAEGKGNRRQRRSLYLCAQAKLIQLTTNLNKKIITAISTARFYMIRDGHRKPAQLVVIGLQDGSLRAFYLDLETMTIPTKTCAFAVNTAPITAIDCSAIQDSEVTCDRGPRVLNKIVALSASSGAYILNINATPTGRISFAPLSDISSLVRSRVPPQVVASAGQASVGSILVAVPRVSSYRTPRVHVILLRHGKRILLAKLRPLSSNVKWSGVNAIKLFKSDPDGAVCQLAAVFTGTNKDDTGAKFFELSSWSIENQVVTYQATHDISSRVTSSSRILDLYPSTAEDIGFKILDSQQFDREGFVGVDTESLIPPDTFFESDIESEVESDTEHAAGEFPDAIRPEDMDQMLSSPSTDNGSTRQSSVSPQRDRFHDDGSENESECDSSTESDAHPFPLSKNVSDLDASSDRSDSVEPWSELTDEASSDLRYPGHSAQDLSMLNADDNSDTGQGVEETSPLSRSIGSPIAEQHEIERVPRSRSPSTFTDRPSQSLPAVTIEPEELAEMNSMSSLADNANENVPEDLPSTSSETPARQTEELDTRQDPTLNDQDILKYTYAQISIPVPVYDILDGWNAQNTGDHADTSPTDRLSQPSPSTRASNISRTPLTILSPVNTPNSNSPASSTDKRKPAHDALFSGPESVKRRKSADEEAVLSLPETDRPQNSGPDAGTPGESVAVSEYEDHMDMEDDAAIINEFTKADTGATDALDEIPIDTFEQSGSFDMDMSEDYTQDMQHNISKETVFTSYESLAQVDTDKADTTAADSISDKYCSSDDGYQTPDAPNDDDVTEPSFCDALQDFEDASFEYNVEEKETLLKDTATSDVTEGRELRFLASAASMPEDTSEQETMDHLSQTFKYVEAQQQHDTEQLATRTRLENGADKTEKDINIGKPSFPSEPTEKSDQSLSETEEPDRALLMSEASLMSKGKSPPPSPEHPTYKGGYVEEPLTPMEPDTRDNVQNQSDDDIPLEHDSVHASDQDHEVTGCVTAERWSDHPVHGHMPSKMYPTYHAVIEEAIRKERQQADTPIEYPISILYLEDKSAGKMQTYFGPSRNKEQIYTLLDIVFQGHRTDSEVLNDTAENATFTDEELGFILAYVIEYRGPVTEAFGMYLFARNGRLKLALYLYFVTRHDEVRFRCADMAVWTASTIFDFSPVLRKDDVLRMAYALLV
ncbi:hypothetical protein BCR43DRAFT_559848 [Syncephalastrum racemosum]|uniref:Uncharacterized protein n=1 Tax=Syncephalastrum racemosum TaxID=13706 RepID=A0A1X2HU93_SYNRA|nr:hypothetical protein BCR43DRAFT_559848 [Syncephalastrum racemosum]